VDIKQNAMDGYMKTRLNLSVKIMHDSDMIVSMFLTIIIIECFLLCCSVFLLT